MGEVADGHIVSDRQSRGISVPPISFNGFEPAEIPESHATPDPHTAETPKLRVQTDTFESNPSEWIERPCPQTGSYLRPRVTAGRDRAKEVHPLQTISQRL